MVEKYEKIYEVLFSLCSRIIEKTIAHRDEGYLEVIPYEYVPVKDIDYFTEVYHHDWEKIRLFNFYRWKGTDFGDFIDSILMTLSEVEIAANELKIAFNISVEIARDFGLSRLSRFLAYNIPNENISLKNVDKYIEAFINDYVSESSGSSRVWNVELSLGNIYIESDEIEISNNVYLRRPSKEQLAIKRPQPNEINSWERKTGKQLLSGAILSFSMEVAGNLNPSERSQVFSHEVECWLSSFRLLKPSGVRTIHESFIPVSVIEHSFSENKEEPHDTFWKGRVDYRDTSTFKLYLRKNDEAFFIDSIKRLMPFFKGIPQTSYLSGGPYDLAFHRYNDSLLKTEVNAYRVLSAISSLEALLSESGTEIVFKIRLRVAKLLSLFDFNPLEVSLKMKDAYDLRSKLVHGSKADEKLLDFARNSVHEIINYTRICLLVSLQLKSVLSKNALIGKIDNSLIDKASHEDLTELIVNNVRIPIINPYSSVTLLSPEN
ncbi:MAG TPA: HEPN domain-containing protein [Bacteroidia bacterium]|nr:HEPN domain-containing protein [Bacteroidia bacterium]HRH08964.1 HEPN domain-containing protein [Bacteroidia bacterium]